MLRDELEAARHHLQREYRALGDARADGVDELFDAERRGADAGRQKMEGEEEPRRREGRRRGVDQLQDRVTRDGGLPCELLLNNGEPPAGDAQPRCLAGTWPLTSSGHLPTRKTLRAEKMAMRAEKLGAKSQLPPSSLKGLGRARGARFATGR